MDINEALKTIKLTDELIEMARTYCEARKLSSEAQRDLDILLASKYLTSFRAIKRNLGYDMALLMCVEQEGEVGRKLYDTYLTKQAEYKGLEKILDAIQSKVSFMQSLMRYESDGEKGFNQIGKEN